MEAPPDEVLEDWGRWTQDVAKATNNKEDNTLNLDRIDPPEHSGYREEHSAPSFNHESRATNSL